MLHSRQLTSLLALVLALTGLTWASIENEPVRVTHRNSGPRYDIDEVERTRLAPESHTNEDPTGFRRQSSEVSEHESPFGHATVRRIFLVPMMPAAQSGDASLWSRGHSADRSESEDSNSAEERPSLFGSNSNRPFWPFLPSTPRHHLFGSDEASRSRSPMAAPAAEASADRPMVVEQPQSAGEREEAAAADRLRPLFDPIQMMIELMQQALNPAAQSSGSNFFNDLSKDASSAAGSKPDEATQNKPTDSAGQLEKPAKGSQANNETREDIVEIEGKKYMRKTIINRHVGENIIFMTKRLIFVPLNETDQDATTTTTTMTPTTTTTISTTTDANPSTSVSTGTLEPAISSTSVPELISSSITTEAKRQLEEATTTVASATASEVPITSAPVSAAPTTTPISVAEETTAAPKESSWTDRVSEAIDKAAERIVEAGSVSSSTVKPKEI